MPPELLIDRLTASGLRGRGGAGFPTGAKWRTVRDNSSSVAPTTVVVNGAEGEPGTFKDRTILRCNPYHVLEGALIAALAVDANLVVVALKGRFTTEVDRVRTAITELEAAGWCDAVAIIVFEGPDEYLYGEETALLEAIEDRKPFPRIAPPYRRGVSGARAGQDGVDTASGLSADVVMAGAEGSEAPPALIDNIETLANVPRIIDRGPEWFRTEGTDGSPGTIVCTVTGRVQHPGVAELLMGTTLRDAIDEVGGGPLPGHHVVAAMPGVSSAMIGSDDLDTPLTYEAMAAIGSGLGSAGFVVLDETSDPVALVAGVARFLAIESCGQCSPCKQDGLALADLLENVSRSKATDRDIQLIAKKVATVADGARCSLARQQQTIIGGLLAQGRATLDAHVSGAMAGRQPEPVAELTDIDDGSVTIDELHQLKQPDWSYTTPWSGETPVERFTDHRQRDDGRE